MHPSLHTSRHPFAASPTGRILQQAVRGSSSFGHSQRSAAALTVPWHQRSVPVCAASPLQAADRVCASGRTLLSSGRRRGAAAASAAKEAAKAFGGPELPNGDSGGRGRKPLPTQGDAVVEGPGDGSRLALTDREDDGPLRGYGDLDYLAELIAMQQNGPKDIGFFGTRNMGWMHQQLIEVLSYAMVLTGNHIYTSGATGTNAAVIRGALRAEKPDLLTVVLPQSLSMQPPESQELLAEVKNVISKPEADHLSLLEASRICNQDIVSRVKQVICFAFHDSRLLLETCREASEQRRTVALFYLD